MFLLLLLLFFVCLLLLFFLGGRSDLSLSATFHWPFSCDGHLVAIMPKISLSLSLSFFDSVVSYHDVFFCVQIHTSPHQSQPPTLVMPSKGSNPSEQVATSMWQQPLTGPLLPRAAIDWEPTWPPSVMHFHKPSCSCLWLKVLAFTLLQTVCRLFGLAWVTYR